MALCEVTTIDGRTLVKINQGAVVPTWLLKHVGLWDHSEGRGILQGAGDLVGRGQEIYLPTVDGYVRTENAIDKCRPGKDMSFSLGVCPFIDERATGRIIEMDSELAASVLDAATRLSLIDGVLRVAGTYNTNECSAGINLIAIGAPSSEWSITEGVIVTTVDLIADGKMLDLSDESGLAPIVEGCIMTQSLRCHYAAKEGGVAVFARLWGGGIGGEFGLGRVFASVTGALVRSEGEWEAWPTKFLDELCSEILDSGQCIE